jgi:hypothetical protein
MEKYNFNFKAFTENLKKFFSNLGKVAIIFTAMASGYATSEIYHRYEMTLKTHKMQAVKTLEKDVSVAMNEKSELIFMDRTSGTYQMFDAQVGQEVFNLYASKIYNAQKSK